MDNPRSLHDLRRFWEAIALGQPAAPGDLDPELAALVQRLHATPDVPPPDPSFASHLREQLMHATTAPVLPASAPPNGRLPDSLAPGLFPPLVAPRRAGRAWPIARVAIVLLLLAAIIGAYVFTQRTRPVPTFTPAISTPAPAGAMQDWPMYSANPERSGVSGGAGPVGSPVTLWTYHADGPVSRSPAVADGVAYLQNGDGQVTALDTASGEVLWQNATTDTGENTPAVVGDTLYLTNLSGQVVALDRQTGDEKWRAGELLAAECTPLVLDGALYMGTDDGKVVAFDAATGEQQWQSAASGGIFRSLAAGGSLIYAGTMNGRVDALDQATGEARWHFTGGDESQTIGTPTYSDGAVYVNYNGVMHALDAATGEERWSKEFAGARPATVADGMIFSGGLDGTVYAIDAATGDDRWTFPTGDEIQAAPALVDSVLYIASFDRTLYALDASTGTERWSFDLDGAVVYGPSVAAGVIYAGTDAGTLYAIGGTGTEQLAAPVDATPSAANPGAAPDATPSIAASAPIELLWRYGDPVGSSSAIAGISLAPDGNVWITDGPAGQFVILSPDGEVVERWGSPGDGPGEFNFRRDGSDAFGLVTFAPDGSFYVADSHNFRIQHFAADRTFISAFGEFGDADGQFQEPVQVLIDGSGNLYVIDAKRDDVQKFAPDGTFLLKFSGHGGESGQINNAGAGGIDADGNIWVGDGGNARLLQFSPEGELLQTIGATQDTLRSPSGFTIDSAGRLWVGDWGNSKVEVFTPDGTLILALDGSEGGGTPFDGANNLIVDGRGNLYVHEYGNHEGVRKYRLLDPVIGGAPDASATPVTVSLAASAAGAGPRIDDVSYLQTIASPNNPFPAPGGIDVGPDGTLFVADSIKNLVYLFDEHGQQQAIWGGPDDPEHHFLFGNESFGAGDITVGPDGSIYVLEMLGNRIQKLAPDGTPLKTWGAPGAGDGRFNKPSTLTIGPDGDLYVADSGNNRIEVFDTDGNFLRAWGEAGTADGKFRGPWEIAFRPDGTLLVSDAGLRIGAFDTDGAFLGNFRDRSGSGSDLDDSYGIRVDAAGNIYLVDYRHNQVSIVAPDGATLAAWGAGGNGPGTFNLPSSLALDSAGRLYVTDDDDRVQVFQITPSLFGGTPATPVP